MKLRCMLCGKLIEEELVCNEPVDEFDDEYDDDLWEAHRRGTGMQ